MQRYKDFRPTQFDPTGLACDDQQEWFVAPCSQTRDSGPLARSNYRVLLADLEKEGIEHEEHRFGHWGPGWFEIILVEPTERGEKWCAEWEAALSDYPIADESDFGELESEERWETWQSWYHRTAMRQIVSDFGLSDAAESILETEWGSCTLERWLTGEGPEITWRNVRAAEWCLTDSGCELHGFKRAIDSLDRDIMAAMLRAIRAEVRREKEGKAEE